MPKLLLQLTALLTSLLLLLGAALWPAVHRPYFDPFYARFTSPAAGSLVLGTSLASQGVRPAVLRARLGSRYQGPWQNYAFTLYESPYGPAYLASVQRKLDPATRHGLFVLAVDAWALSIGPPARPGGPPVFPEDQAFIGQLHNVSQNPNFEYLASQLRQPLYRVLLHDTATIERLHPDGWLEIALPAPSADTALLHRRVRDKLASYRALAATSHFSPERLASFRQLVAFLKQHGQVVVIHMPSGPQMLALERSYQPGYPQFIRRTTTELGVPYFDYTNLHYPTTDGNHLWNGVTAQFTERLANDIAGL